jgi:1-acyl-sn-glycerol-3-phosphate acyltransferase
VTLAGTVRRLPRRIGAGLLRSGSGATRAILAVVLAAHFRRVRVRDRDQFPRGTQVLLVANHPASWTDVVVLEVVLRRRLHFVAHGGLFKSWPRALLLRLFGALPVSVHDDDPDQARRNAETLARAEGLFDGGEVVAMFPEGRSATDRSLLPLKSGAAVLALDYRRKRGDTARLALVPVGLHYSDRAAFRSDVLVSIGVSIDPDAPDLARIEDPAAAAAELTGRIESALRELIVEIPAGDPGQALAAIESALAHGPHALTPTSSPVVLRRLTALERTAPADFSRLVRTSRIYLRARHALGGSGFALTRGAPGAGEMLTLALGSVPAAAGLALHLVPIALTIALPMRIAPDAPRVAFARLATSLVVFPLFYVALGLVLVRVPRLGFLGVGAGLAFAATLGGLSLVWTLRAREWIARWRSEARARRHPRLAARERATRILLTEFATAGGPP